MVVERDRTQAEFKLDLDAYIKRRLTPHLMRTRGGSCRRITTCSTKSRDQYGVPANTIVAVWALESNLGRFTGVRPTVSGAGDAGVGRAARPFFRGELFDALDDPQSRRHRAGAPARIVGGRDGAGAVHAVQLSEVRRRTSTATDAATSGPRRPTSSRRSPTT